MSYRRVLATLWGLSACVGLVAQPVESIDQDWYVADVGPGVTPVFDFGPLDRVHLLVHADEQLVENGQVTYAVAPSFAGPWRREVLILGYFYGPGDLRVTPDGIAHTTFHDHLGVPRHYAIDPDGAPTLHHVPPAGSHDGWDSTIAIDRLGRVHLSAISSSLHGATSSLEYGVFDGSAWTFGVVEGSGAFVYSTGTALALDASDVPAIAFNNAADFDAASELVVARQLASGVEPSWEFEVVVARGPGGRYPSLAFDAEDRLHLAWYDLDAVDSRHAVIRHAVREGSQWTLETVAELEHLRHEYVDLRRPLSLLIDGSGAPQLAFGDARGLYHAIRGPAGWQIETPLVAGGDRYRTTAILRLDSGGNPAIAFWEDSESNPRGTVRFAVRRQRPAPLFHRADPDESGQTDISDAVRVFGYLFLGGQAPRCLESADINNSGRIDISDGVYLLGHLFLASVLPPLPGFAPAPCGPDPDVPGSAGDLGCEVYPPCGG